MEQISFQITLAAQHGLDTDELSADRQNFLIANECATSALSLFWVLAYVLDNEVFNDEREWQETTRLVALNSLAKLGYAFSSQLSDSLEKLEDSWHQLNKKAAK